MSVKIASERLGVTTQYLYQVGYNAMDTQERVAWLIRFSKERSTEAEEKARLAEKARVLAIELSMAS